MEVTLVVGTRHYYPKKAMYLVLCMDPHMILFVSEISLSIFNTVLLENA